MALSLVGGLGLLAVLKAVAQLIPLGKSDGGILITDQNHEVNDEPVQAPKPVSQFYRRPLPSCDGNVVPFSSPDGRLIFEEALKSGHGDSFFPLIEQFRTQDEPAYCGVSTLTMVLNALSVDPGRLWKGPWRWYCEEMLDCCRPLDHIKVHGLTFAEWDCLARCNGVKTSRRYASESSVEEFRRAVEQVTSARREAGDEKGQGRPQQARRFLVVSYTRKELKQTGSGHFSPIGAYDPGSDMVLVLDVARFKYPPHWVTLPMLFNAMMPRDTDTNKSRGYFIVEKSHRQSLILFRLKGMQHPISRLLTILASLVKELEKNWREEENQQNLCCAEKTLERLLELCLTSLDNKDEEPVLSTILSEFSSVRESSTRKFQKWHIEIIPREHLQAMSLLVKEIEKTLLFQTIRRVFVKRKWCTHCAGMIQLACNNSTKYSVNKEHLLTILFLTIIPKTCPLLEKQLGVYLRRDSMCENLEKEVTALAEAWDGLCGSGTVASAAQVSCKAKPKAVSGLKKGSGCCG